MIWLCHNLSILSFRQDVKEGVTDRNLIDEEVVLGVTGSTPNSRLQAAWDQASPPVASRILHLNFQMLSFVLKTTTLASSASILWAGLSAISHTFYCLRGTLFPSALRKGRKKFSWKLYKMKCKTICLKDFYSSST